MKVKALLLSVGKLLVELFMDVLFSLVFFLELCGSDIAYVFEAGRTCGFLKVSDESHLLSEFG